jgi:shikimate kinase
MTAKNIIIVGITGVGKTIIGRFLSEKLNKEFIDLDKYIEVSCGVDIPTIFELEGENGFRDRESLALKQVLSQTENFVLSLGGGCVIRAENRQLIARSNSFVLQLVADLDVIVERLVKSPNKRPLLANQDIRQKIQNLFAERKDYYEMVSDMTINTTNLKPSQIVTKLAQYL